MRDPASPRALPAAATPACAAAPPRQPLPSGAGLAYGLLGLPLAFVALPLYVQWPAYYASTLGVSLAPLGVLLLAVRAADAVVDPWLGQQAGRLLQRGLALWALAGAAALLWLGFLALFFPPDGARPQALLWGGLALVLTCTAYSVATLIHQAWGARLPGGAAGQAGWMAWREGAALVGVVAASVLPSLGGWPFTAAVLALTLVVGLVALRGAPVPLAMSLARPGSAPVPAPAPRARAVDPAASPAGADVGTAPVALTAPWRHRAWRRLMVVYLLNGIANAIPATLLLFFVRDRLQAPQFEAAFLAVYFLAATVSLPVWVRVAARLGLARTWQLSMGLAVAAFIGAARLEAGDATAFFVVCAATGLALGADLMAPPALLAQWLRRTEARSASGAELDGVAFGWWGAATKLTLALAAGLVLPALDGAGYAPGTREPGALAALSLAYGLVPCGFKLLAAWLLGRAATQDPGPALSGVVDIEGGSHVQSS